MLVALKENLNGGKFEKEISKLLLEYSTMVELPLLAQEILVQIQARTNILLNSTDFVGCVK